MYYSFRKTPATRAGVKACQNAREARHKERKRGEKGGEAAGRLKEWEETETNEKTGPPFKGTPKGGAVQRVDLNDLTQA